jgi:hypothetical protein
VQQQIVERVAPRSKDIKVREKDDAEGKQQPGKKDEPRKLSSAVAAKLKGGS